MFKINNNWETLTYFFNDKDITDKPCMLVVDDKAYPVEWVKNHTSYGDMGHTYNVTRSEMQVMATIGDIIKVPVRITDSNINLFKTSSVVLVG